VSQTDDPDRAIDALVAKLTADLEATAAAPRFGWRRVVLYAVVLILLLLVAYLLSTFVPTNNVGAFAGVLSGLAALALAILTALLLVLNQRLIAATYKMAQATAAEALATLAEARASGRQVAIATRTMETMQLDQEMGWRPYLLSSRSMGTSLTYIRNVGRGPALGVLCLERYLPDKWWVGGPLPVPVTDDPRKAPMIEMRDMPNPIPKELLGHQPAPEVVIVCCDQFGNWFRFEPWQPSPVVWRLRSKTPKPDWVEWVETFGAGPDVPPPEQDARAEVC
jgi:hypothetical protein